jgi:AraC-like DNA-binding protein
MPVTESSPYPQPVEGHREFQLLYGTQESVEYLPGTSIRIWYTHLNTSYPIHWHNALEIIACEKEHYIVDSEGVEYRVAPGEVLLMPSGITHTLKPAKGCNGFVYLLNIEFLNAIKSAAHVMPILAHPIYLSEKNNPALLMPIRTILRQIRDDYFSDNRLRELSIDAHILTMMAQLIQHYFESVTPTHNRCDKQKEYCDRFTEVINYINLHYADSLTIEETARQFGLSKFYFARLFKQHTHYTFCDYLTFRRIKAAEQLLVNPTLSITDIAFNVGFASISTFSRAFREQKKCTPSEYRHINVRNMPAIHT